MTFKAKAYKTIYTQKAEDTFTDENHCRFGQWLQTDEAKGIRNNPKFSELKEAHKQVHQNVLQIVDFVKQKILFQKADEVLNDVKNAEKASEKLFAVLKEVFKANK